LPAPLPWNRKRQGTAAVQDASRIRTHGSTRERLGVRLSSAALIPLAREGDFWRGEAGKLPRGWLGCSQLLARYATDALDWSSIGPLLVLYCWGILSGLYARHRGFCWRVIRFGILHSNSIWTLLLGARLRAVFGRGRWLGWRRLCGSELFRRGERQAAAAFEEPAQTAIAGAALAAHDTGSRSLACLPAGAATAQPILPGYRAIDWNRGGF
jgi:hypothetical protein